MFSISAIYKLLVITYFTVAVIFSSLSSEAAFTRAKQGYIDPCEQNELLLNSFKLTSIEQKDLSRQPTCHIRIDPIVQEANTVSINFNNHGLMLITYNFSGESELLGSQSFGSEAFYFLPLIQNLEIYIDKSRNLRITMPNETEIIIDTKTGKIESISGVEFVLKSIYDFNDSQYIEIVNSDSPIVHFPYHAGGTTIEEQFRDIHILGLSGECSFLPIYLFKYGFSSDVETVLKTKTYDQFNKVITDKCAAKKSPKEKELNQLLEELNRELSKTQLK